MTRSHKVRYSAQVLVHFHSSQDAKDPELYDLPGVIGMLQIVDEDPDKAGDVDSSASSLAEMAEECVGIVEGSRILTALSPSCIPRCSPTLRNRPT